MTTGVRSSDQTLSPTIERWLESLRAQGGVQVGTDDPRVKLLTDCCEAIGRTPEELVEFCFLRRKADGSRFLSKQRRIQVGQEIDDYVGSLGLTGYQFAVAANTVRSFLIHNGVFMGAARP